MSTYEIFNLAEKDLVLNLEDDFKSNQVKDYMYQYFITDENVNSIKQQFETEIQNGLQHCDSTTLQDLTALGMKVTFFTELFDATENGKCVVLYLNSRHLLVMLAKIKPGFPLTITKDYFMVSESIRRSPYIKIFEFLCDCLLKFFTQRDLLGKVQTVGFCSDLPLILFGLDHCMVWYFTRNAPGFPLNCYDVRKCFEIVLLKERYRDLKINLVAFLNDNTSMLIDLSYKYSQPDILLNLTSDCNIVYWEEVANVSKWKRASEGNEFKMVLIDTELGNFGGGGFLDFLATDMEFATVTTSLKSARHATIDRFISQHYILELIRHVLVDLHHNLSYCRHSNIENLRKEGITLEDMCAFANSQDIDHAAVLLPGKTIGGSEEDAKVAKYVCKVVLIRAAVLTAVCLASFLARSPKEEFVIAVNSPLLEKHREYETYVRNVTKRFAPEKKFEFVWIGDNGVCEGAALATIIANRLNKTNLRF